MAVIKLLYNMPLIVTVDTEEGVVLSVEEDGEGINPADVADVWDADYNTIATDDSDDPIIERAYEIANENEWPAFGALG